MKVAGASPHYARDAGCDRDYGRASLRAVGSVRGNAVGAASPRRAPRRQARDRRDRPAAMSEQWQGGLPRRRRTSLQRRIVAALIVEERGRAFERGCGGKLGGQSCHLRKVEAPDALCAPVPNAFGGRSSLPPAPDLGSGVSCIVRARARGSGISFSLAPSALCLAPPKNSS